MRNDPKKTAYRGFSILLCIGRSGGWGIRRDGPALRVHMGPVAIDFVCRDFQRQVVHLVDAAERAEAEVARLTAVVGRLQARR
jgi:hypothetical protein